MMFAHLRDLRIVQLTDTHIRPAGELLYDTVDTYANLTLVLDRLRASGPVDALVLSGDLTDNGAPEGYRRLRAAVEPVAAELGARVVYVMGNHDERVSFGVELLGHAPGSVLEPHDQAVEVAGLRIIALDSTTPGRHGGALEDSQLTWLGRKLRRPAPRGTLLVLHHPPLPSGMAAAELLNLDQAVRLAAVVANTDVRLILCGHNHMTAAGALAGIPVWVGPALAYRFDAMPPPGRMRALRGFGYSRIDVLGLDFVVSAVEATPAPEVYERDENEMLAHLRAIDRAEAR
ncbi:metallophosphoesterase [Nocardia goodfellowii]|uniref:3',5'-cyclic AMP phosphodiesterase CpdA n=1 Tax=Nocardia goodfellowii TaxID=882446 RepID=A0ABS4QQF6_9NOCA|nr:metallophosphoesterase [Nocardia goodfellowii]MBP2193942.1 3',5'-cyclic AMP phosphodiesterase CpdA [Nocardia goodfellowii]